MLVTGVISKEGDQPWKRLARYLSDWDVHKESIAIGLANESQAISNYYAQNGYETLTSTPDELRKFQAVESEKWRRAIGAAGIEKE